MGALEILLLAAVAWIALLAFVVALGAVSGRADAKQDELLAAHAGATDKQWTPKRARRVRALRAADRLKISA